MNQIASIGGAQSGAPAGISAAEAELAGAGRDFNKYLSVTVQGETYGIQVLKVREIIEYAAETALPMMPHFVRGAINLRGAGVPVIDLGRRLGASASEVGRRSCIVIVEAPGVETDSFDAGLLVDSVDEVVDIGRSEIEATPSFGGQWKSEFLRGMGKVKGRLVKLLDVDRLLSLEDLAAANSAAEVGVEAEETNRWGTA